MSLSLLGMIACLPTTALREVWVSGEVQSGASGPVYVEIHLAQTGEGELSFSGGWLESLRLEEPGVFEQAVEVPVDRGQGLAVYAWQDLDRDGLLCAVGVEDEYAGAAVSLADPLPYTLSLSPQLTDACAGPEVSISLQLSQE